MYAYISQDLIKSFFLGNEIRILLYVHVHEWNTQYYESYRFLMRLLIFLSRALSSFLLPDALIEFTRDPLL